jgi:glycerophosphoryl diester phosphodiesterase
MQRILSIALSVSLLGLSVHAHALLPVLPGPRLLCHRTANEDVPENTLESLEQAALLGCNVVEIDLRRTLDGELVLNHDGVLERLTDSTGNVEDKFYAELATADAGSWMGGRFDGLRIARFDDVLRLARSLDIRLVLDIKTPGIGAQVLQMLDREGMLEQVEFNGEWSDIRTLRPQAHDAGYQTAWVRAPVTADQVARFHREGKAVVANFSDSPQEMDLDAMKRAVAAGVDAINVDYPRLGAEAVGRPVEKTIAELTDQAATGDSSARGRAILQLGRYRGFPLKERFVRWLGDPDPHVARAAALALLQPEYKATASGFVSAISVTSVSVRANAAWALGRLKSADAVPALLPLLADTDGSVRAEAYASISRLPGDVPLPTLSRGLTDKVPAVRGAAAEALARHAPSQAATLIDSQLRREIDANRALYLAYSARQPKSLSAPEIATVMASYRCQMQMIKALVSLPGSAVTSALAQQAFRPGSDFSQMNDVVAAFNLWDRIGTHPKPAIDALGSSDPGVADRAEWMLLHAVPQAAPFLRAALQTSPQAVQIRILRILSFAGDSASIPLLQSMHDGPLATQAADAVERIRRLLRK